MNRQLKRYWKQMLADRRKLAVFLSLFCVGLLLWGRLLLDRSVPRTAVANPEQVAAGVDSSEGAASLAGPTGPRQPVSVIADYGPVRRDLFAFNAAFFPQIERPSPNVTNESDPEAGLLAKLAAQRADEFLQKQAQAMAIRAEAKALNLQSTLVGQSARALINGQLFSVGEFVNGFEIVEIGSRTVKLRKQEIEVVLEM